MTKKLIILLLISVMAVTACGGGGDDNDADSDTPTEEVVVDDADSSDAEVDVTEEADVDSDADATEEADVDSDADATEEADVDSDADATEEAGVDSDADATEEVDADSDADVDAGGGDVVLIAGYTLLDQDCPLQMDFQYPEGWELANSQVNNYVFNVTAGDDSQQLSFNVRGMLSESQAPDTLARASGDVVGQIESNGLMWDVVAQDRDNGTRRYQFVVFNRDILYYNVRLDVTQGAVDDETILVIADAMTGNGCA